MPPHLLPAFQTAMRHSATPAVALAWAEGLIEEGALFRALAGFHGLPYLSRDTGRLEVVVDPAEVKSCLRHFWLRLRDRRGRTFVVAAPLDPAARLLCHLGLHGPGGHRVIDAIASPSTIRTLIDRKFSTQFTRGAVWGLSRKTPEFSAQTRVSAAQGAALLACGILTAAGAWFAPAVTFFVALAGLGGVFFLVSIFRLACIFSAFAGRRPPPRVSGKQVGDDKNLPIYTVLVPLFHEANIVHQTVEALLQIDYPRVRLDIKLILEKDDAETRQALERLDLPGCVEVVLVPSSWPRTKPKAMNYALARARGSLVAVFDAEDIPHSSQLRIAVRAFAGSHRSVACYQCRLGFYNASQNWLTGQFAIEYAVLFEVVMPALDRLGLPLMLGGTSNHFRASALLDAGGWDAHNVTEDADLGVRLVRLGYSCRWLDSLTLEEAASTPRNWFGQRVRWLRGWIQTYFVHMKNPMRLFRDLGPLGFFSFQAAMGGVVVSAMVFPVFLAGFVWLAASGVLLAHNGHFAWNGLILVSAVNLLFGFGVAAELVVFGLFRIGRPRFFWQMPLMPVYWFCISLASYCAFWRFIRQPFGWEKTVHQARRPVS